jgi:Tfp pilus assembly protein PilF
MGTNPTRRGGSHTRWAGVSAAVIALAVIASACGGGGGKSEATNAVLARALAEVNQGNFDSAKKDFQQVLKKDSGNKYAHYNLGYIAQTQGTRADAEKEYRLAIATDPKFVPALYNLAIAVTADGDLQGAIALYRQSIKANDKDANSHFNLGLLLRQTGKPTEGNSQVRRAVQLSPALRQSAEAQHIPL